MLTGRQRGWSLLDALLALLLLSVGLLGIASLQLRTVATGHDIWLQAVAQLAALDMIELSHAHQGTPSQWQVRWREYLALQLPDGDGQVELTQGLLRVEVRWSGRLPPLERELTLYALFE